MKGGKGKASTKKETPEVLKPADDRLVKLEVRNGNHSLVLYEKAPYEAKAAKRKSEYEKLISAYNKKQESNADDGDEESDRSKSEVNDEDDEESGEDEDDEDDNEDDD
ncbi:hypothetical protein M5K25_011810 [Dendrobium thyrsiflorum]|uniref:Uncharacterized protein n=1 Tax=Dendrobium thyrsiflorum TaxID=117978 RepID=A0ABD0V419_DENTH